ncbi:class I SAM-dependent methyltransferase [Halomarina litorea]|uniref:class I SAM-dependent methyltransferase n=1 Tax=Halomarina litorea TaxID=2961595 RepID=UPI0020C31D17|nr:class I SAM-dependent methyltransferase [Halomarina sp. BCD28]
MPTRDRTTGDYRELLLLAAARHSGALDALVTTTGTPEGVAAETGVSERAAALVVTALADRGFLREVGGEYQPTNRLLGFVTKTDVRSIGRLPHALDVLDDWVALPETMRTGHPPDRGEHWLRNEMGAGAARDDTAVRAAVTAAVRERPAAASVLVLADPAGRHAVEFAERGFDVTLLDTPERTAVNRKSLEHERVRLVAGDPLVDLPSVDAAPVDLVFATGVLHRHDEAAVRRLFENARAAVAGTGEDECGTDRAREGNADGRANGGGGVAVVVDAVRGETPDASLVALEALASGGTGACHDAAALTGWLADAGFAGSVEAVPGLADRAVVGRAID